MQSLWAFHRIPIVILCSACLAYFKVSIWYLLPLLFVVYLVTGGWRFAKVVIMTLPRDFFGLIYVIDVFFTARRYQRHNETIASLFDKTVDKYRDRIAFICEEFRWKFSDVSRYANAAAHFISQRISPSGKKGDVIALLMETRPEYVGCWLGVAKTGSITALLNHNQRNETLLHSIKVADPKTIICGEELLPVLVEIAGQLPAVPVIIVPLSEGPPSNSTIIPQRQCKSTATCCDRLSHCEVMSLAKLEPFFSKGQFTSPVRSFNDPFLFIYTSGTTGLPKAAKIASSRFWYMVHAPHTLPKLRDDEIVYVTLPIYHSNGGVVGVGQALLYGCTVVLRKRFSASQFWDDCVKYDCTAFIYIGEICRYLFVQPRRDAETQHHIKYAIGNGLRENIWRDFQKRFNIKRIIEFYGSTEGNANALNYVGVVGSVGFTSRILPMAYPIFLIKVDETTGEILRDPITGLCVPCEPWEAGELIGRIASSSPWRHFDGYAVASETERKIVRNVFYKGDLFFRSGDILVQDEYGHFFFKDRTGDTFRWRGENVSTLEVESVVSTATGLKDTAVYGVEVPGVEGRAGMAAIVDPNREVDITNGLAVTLQKSLPSYGVPVFIRVMEAIPRTTTYKYMKGSLQRDAFNPEQMAKDPLFYLDTSVAPRRYSPLTPDIYRKILSGEIRI